MHVGGKVECGAVPHSFIVQCYVIAVLLSSLFSTSLWDNVSSIGDNIRVHSVFSRSQVCRTGIRMT